MFLYIVKFYLFLQSKIGTVYVPFCQFLQNKVGTICLDLSSFILGRFNQTNIPLAFVGYEMIMTNSALLASSAIHRLIFNERSWNKCLISSLNFRSLESSK